MIIYVNAKNQSSHEGLMKEEEEKEWEEQEERIKGRRGRNFGLTQSWVQICTLPPAGCVTSGKLLNLSDSLSPPL